MFFMRSMILRICLSTGALIGLLGVAYNVYTATRGIEDGACGSSAFLFVFGLPTTLLEFPFEMLGIVKGSKACLISLSLLFLVNWTIIGGLIGLILSRIIGINKPQ